MQHPDPADLAVLALGDHLDEDGLYEHITECDRCSSELSDLRVIVSQTASDSGPGRGPSADVWSAIVAEVGPEMDGVPEADRLSVTFADPVQLGAAEDNSVLDGVSIPVDPAAVLLSRRDEVAARRIQSAAERPAGRAGIGPSSRRGTATGLPSARDGLQTGRSGNPGEIPDGSVSIGPSAGASAPTPPARRRRWVPLVAAAAVGLVIGGGVVALVGQRESDQTVLATTPLLPVEGSELSGKAGQFGVAELVRANGAQWVTVSGAELPATSDSYEVWLIGGDDRLVSLGSLHDGGGTFTVPDGIDITQYPVVDISAEPPDGVPTHSGDSLVRGTL